MGEPKSKEKPFVISKWLVWEAYQRVKANQGAPGVDGCSIEDFEADLKNNLYRVWNRMSSGSYFLLPAKAVEIPKSHGGTRILGVPTVADRVAQTVVAMELRKRVEPVFHQILWLPAESICVRCGGDMPATLLGIPRGGRFGHPKIFRQRRS